MREHNRLLISAGYRVKPLIGPGGFSAEILLVVLFLLSPSFRRQHITHRKMKIISTTITVVATIAITVVDICVPRMWRFIMTSSGSKTPELYRKCSLIVSNPNVESKIQKFEKHKTEEIRG